MRWNFLVLPFLAMPAAAVAQQSGVADSGGKAGSAIEAVIGDQIAAFRKDDFERAFGFASPGIRAMFGTAANFGTMVKGGYPMVWRPAEVRFLGLHDAAGRPVERVLAVDGAGKSWFLDYHMLKVGGAWRIDGVDILPAQGTGV